MTSMQHALGEPAVTLPCRSESDLCAAPAIDPCEDGSIDEFARACRQPMAQASFPPFPPFPPYSPFAPFAPYPPFAPCPGAPGAPCEPVCEWPCETTLYDDDSDEPRQPPHAPDWGPPDGNGWQRWSAPFTLPLTRENWPPRYQGAPDPATTPADAILSTDLAEAGRRLSGLSLKAELDAAGQSSLLSELHDELTRLVEVYPAQVIASVGLNMATAANNAPTLGLSLMQKLLVLAVDPYLARVLGVYFVDTTAAPDADYDYCVAGFWDGMAEPARVLTPGLASAAALARGAAQSNGATIAVDDSSPASTLWRWTRDDASGQFAPRLDPGAPQALAAPVSDALAKLAPAQQPAAVLIVLSTGGVPFVATPAPAVSIALGDAYVRVDVQVSGLGRVQALSGNTVVATAVFASPAFTWITLNASALTAPIERIVVTGVPIIGLPTIVVSVGEIALRRLADASIGTRYAMLHAPQSIVPTAAPGDPVSVFRHRDADVDAASLRLVPRTLIDVQWPAPDASATLTAGDPVTDPAAMPPPSSPVGFVIERDDSGGSSAPQRLAKRVLAASAITPADSPLKSARRYRCADASLPDPATGWRHRVAGFDLFGVLGGFSQWTAPLGVERIAAAPTTLVLRGFDNRASAGGAASPAPPADALQWSGGTLSASISWSGGTFAMYPDLRSARLTIESVDDEAGGSAHTLVEHDFEVPPPVVASARVVSADVIDALNGKIEVVTEPPFPASGPDTPSALLVLEFADGARERHVVRPQARNAGGGASVSMIVNAGSYSRVGATPADCIGQTAYLIQGCAIPVTLPVPLDIPLAQTSGHGRFAVTGSTQAPFAPDETIVDPNGTAAPRAQPASVAVNFSAPQRLVPPAPPTPTHAIHHEYFDRADFTGRTSRALPFDTPARPGVDGYVLHRAPLQSLALADMKRRLALGNAADANPVVVAGGAPRADLQAWIGALGTWLDSYNKGNPSRAPTSWTLANVLADASARRAFGEHFYGGLLDDELRELANLPDNATGFARVNPKPMAPGPAVSAEVDGKGFGSTVFTLAAVNKAGSESARTGAIGPYYTRPTTPPRAPVLYRVQPAISSVVVAWALDESPDVAGYLVYRADSVEALADLRWFGPDKSAPQTTGLATIVSDPAAAVPISFSAGSIDTRLIALVPHPQLCARDYEGSDMGEVPLPDGTVPDAIDAVHRATGYDATRPPLDQPQAFNYWTPPAAGGIAQFTTASGRARVTGLRIGLAQRVPVVVVATFGGTPRALGALAVRRAAFVDGIGADAKPLDAHALDGYTAPNPAADNVYCVVALDVWGQRSPPSKAFVARPLIPPA